MGFWSRLLGREEERFSIDDYASLINEFTFNGIGYSTGVQQTLQGNREVIEQTFEGYVNQIYKSNGIVFACMLARRAVFTEARFQFRRYENGTASALFGDKSLSAIERPYQGGTTANLLARMLDDADLAGNWFGWKDRENNEVVRLRPDWVDIILEPRTFRGGQAGWRKLGYLYFEGGMRDHEGVPFLVDEVSHFAPIPDPTATWRGMSWLTPVLREIAADKAFTGHKIKHLENGAPQPLDAKILTPSGWSTMGQTRVGDQVIGSDGKPHDVVAVYPQGERDIYRVHFSSGAATECTEDHLWTVASAGDRKRGTTRTMTLGQIMAGGVRMNSGAAKWSVPLVSPVEFDDPGPLPLHPYLLGSLLGDGSFRSNGKGSGGVSMAAHADDADEQQVSLAELLPEGVTISRRDRSGWAEFYFAGSGSPRPNPLTGIIRGLGLFDKLGHEKAIPGPYMRGSVTDRVSLLQGLIDTDGHIDTRQPNTVRFDSTSEELARQLADLAGSLGAIATVRYGRAASARGRQQWRVTISRLPEWITPCRLARKVARYRSQFRGGSYRYIQRVDYVGRKQAQCIGVDSDDHLYITDDFLLTHNTPNMVVKLPEMTPDGLKRFKSVMDANHAGVKNAGKIMYLGGGADVTVVGADFKQLDFKSVQGAGETRIAAAAGVPPVIVGFSEGLGGSSLNQGNYSSARRNFADRTIRPMWRDAAASLEVLVPPPPGAELWFDTRDVAFLREDEKDRADIQSREAVTIRQLIDGGYEPASVNAAVIANDWGLLKHTGLLSVQLQPPGQTQTSDGAQPEIEE